MAVAICKRSVSLDTLEKDCKRLTKPQLYSKLRNHYELKSINSKEVKLTQKIGTKEYRVASTCYIRDDEGNLKPRIILAFTGFCTSAELSFIDIANDKPTVYLGTTDGETEQWCPSQVETFQYNWKIAIAKISQKMESAQAFIKNRKDNPNEYRGIIKAAPNS